jgi:hypothetical protein
LVSVVQGKRRRDHRTPQSFAGAVGLDVFISATTPRKSKAVAERRSLCTLRVVTAAMLDKVAEVVAFSDWRAEVPEDRVCNRDVEEEVRQHKVADVIVAVAPTAHYRVGEREWVCLGAGQIVWLQGLQEVPRSDEGRLYHRSCARR